ncbi:hypothetical protein ACFQ0O_13265 [Saccharopolyspora spinosporotrichia]
MDAAGVVDQLGPEADGRLSTGERVVALVVPTGARRLRRARRGARRVGRARSGRGRLPAAATWLMNAMVARLALDALALRSGDTVAVTGAAGAFGGYVIQFAKAVGLRVIADAQPADAELVRELGAGHVVERGDEVAARIRELAPERVPGLADGAVL